MGVKIQWVSFTTSSVTTEHTQLLPADFFASKSLIAMLSSSVIMGTSTYKGAVSYASFYSL